MNKTPGDKEGGQRVGGKESGVLSHLSSGTSSSPVRETGKISKGFRCSRLMNKRYLFIQKIQDRSKFFQVVQYAVLL